MVAHDDPSVIKLLEIASLRGDAALPETHLRRYRIRLDGGGVAREDLAPDVSPELPRINYRHNNTRDYRWMYAAASDAEWFQPVGEGRRDERRSPGVAGARLLPRRAGVR